MNKKVAKVAVLSFMTGSVVTMIVMTHVYRTNLEFLGIAQKYVEEGLAALRGEIDKHDE